MKYWIRCALTLGYAWSAVVLGAAAAPGADISKVNGSVQVEAGQAAGDLSTVNGSVTVGSDAVAAEVDTVNGSVRIGDRARIGQASTVNGAITVGAGSVVDGPLETVNGGITLRERARVAGGAQTVNGDLRLEGAEVRQGLTTLNGDIHVGTGSRLYGGIHVEKNRNKSWFGSGPQRNPRVTIEQGATVEGPLRFEREVDLYLAPGVQVAAIEGVPPRRFEL